MRFHWVNFVVVTIAFVLGLGLSQPAGAAEPALLFGSLLGGIDYRYDSGLFRLNSMWGLFFPGESGFAPGTENTLTTDVCRADGTVLETFSWYVNKDDPPWWKLSHTGSGSVNFALTEPGDYDLKFAINGKVFYRYPFSITVVESTDIYSPGNEYFIDGDWSEYGYLHWGGDTTSQLYFKTWMRADKNHAEFRQKHVPVLKLYHDSEFVAQFNTDTSNTWAFSKMWEREDFPLSNPAQSSGGLFFGGDLLSRDGSYSLKLYLDGELYGSYDFNVSGGEVALQGRQVRKSTDPLSCIEGGPESFWLRRRTG